MAMTMVEKIMARASGRSQVWPGDLVQVKVDMAIVLDMSFRPWDWRWPVRLWDPEKVAVIFDHLVPATTDLAAECHLLGRQFVKEFGIRRFHDVGADQGIVHQVAADEAYALPGQIMVCQDSHTCSGGALNCAARGIGFVELLHVLCTGETWFLVGSTVRYELEGALPAMSSPKDLFLHIAGKYGSHEGENVEFGGPAARDFPLNARRTISTMAAEISAEFALWEPDEVLLSYVEQRAKTAYEPARPDSGAAYAAVRRVAMGEIEPMVALPDTVINNVVPVTKLTERVNLDQCFIGSCANGTIDDLKIAAAVLKGRRVAPGVRLLITPGSQSIYREAARLGVLTALSEAGALVTPSACGVCAGLGVGVLGPGERCLTASTRNFKGRMGSPEAQIYMASPATVAASAVAGHVVDPREIAGEVVL